VIAFTVEGRENIAGGGKTAKEASNYLKSNTLLASMGKKGAVLDQKRAFPAQISPFLPPDPAAGGSGRPRLDLEFVTKPFLISFFFACFGV
jgi:hypothetical protein